MKKIDCSIIIVNYNTLSLTTECIRSIFRSKTKYSFEIIVVDNSSDDNSVEYLSHEFSEITILQLEKNFGYAVANNYALKKANGKYILFLNSDTVVEENTVQKTLEFLDNHPVHGAYL